MTYQKKGYNKKSLKNLQMKKGRTGVYLKTNRCIIEGCKEQKALKSRFCLEHLPIRWFTK